MPNGDLVAGGHIVFGLDPSGTASRRNTSCAGTERAGCRSAMVVDSTRAGPGDRGQRRRRRRWQTPQRWCKRLGLLARWGSTLTRRMRHLWRRLLRSAGPLETRRDARAMARRQSRPCRGTNTANGLAFEVIGVAAGGGGGCPRRCTAERPVRVPAPRRSDRDPVPVCRQRRLCARTWRSRKPRTLAGATLRDQVLQVSSTRRSESPASAAERRGRHRRQLLILPCARSAAVAPARCALERAARSSSGSPRQWSR